VEESIQKISSAKDEDEKKEFIGEAKALTKILKNLTDRLRFNMAKMSVNELKLELSNVLLDLIGFDSESYSPYIAKAKTIEDLDKIIDLIIQKEDNPKLEKNLVIFWKGIR